MKMESAPAAHQSGIHRNFTAAQAADALGPLQGVGFGSFPADMAEADFGRWFKVAASSLEKGFPEVEGVPLQMWGLRSLMGPLGVCATLSPSSGVNLEWRASIALSKWSCVWLKHGTLPDALRMWVAAAAQTGHAIGGTSLMEEDRRHVLREFDTTTQALMKAVSESDPGLFLDAVLKAVEPNRKTWPLESQEQWGRTLVCAAGTLAHIFNNRSFRPRWNQITAKLSWALLEMGARLVSSAAPSHRRKGIGAMFDTTSKRMVGPAPTTREDIFSDEFLEARSADISLWTTLGAVVGESAPEADRLTKMVKDQPLPSVGHPVMDMIACWPGEFSGWVRQAYLDQSFGSAPGGIKPRF